MIKRYALKKLYEFGDAIVSFRNGSSFLVTTDLSTKYIKKERHFLEKNLHKFKVNEAVLAYKKFKLEKDLRDKVKVFNWTTNTFELLDVKGITYITPLSKVLENEPRDIT